MSSLIKSALVLTLFGLAACAQQEEPAAPTVIIAEPTSSKY